MLCICAFCHCLVFTGLRCTFHFQHLKLIVITYNTSSLLAQTAFVASTLCLYMAVSIQFVTRTHTEEFHGILIKA